MRGSEIGPGIRRSVPQVHRPGLTVLVVVAATMLPATVYLVAPGAAPGRIGLGIAGAERPEVAGAGTLVGHTAVRNVRQPGPVAVREIAASAGRGPRVMAGSAPSCADQQTEREQAMERRRVFRLIAMLPADRALLVPLGWTGRPGRRFAGRVEHTVPPGSQCPQGARGTARRDVKLPASATHRAFFRT
jgi:hypothetical protein